jgi:hypothetical protein
MDYYQDVELDATAVRKALIRISNKELYLANQSGSGAETGLRIDLYSPEHSTICEIERWKIHS